MLRRIFPIGAMFLAIACGGPSGGDLFEAKGQGSTSGNPPPGGSHGSGGRLENAGGLGTAGEDTSGNGGLGGGAGGFSSVPLQCLEGAVEPCACAAGTGARQCRNGTFGECACATCQEGETKSCQCPSGSTGDVSCIGGTWTECSGCAPMPGCPTGMTCTPTDTKSNSPYLCATSAGVPPGCLTATDCAALGVGCTVLPVLGGMCLKLCTP